jgi:hypothetical protein
MPALLVGPLGKILGIGLGLALIALAIWQYGNSRYDKGHTDAELTYVKANSAASIAYERRINDIQNGWWQRYSTAQQTFADNQQRQDPIILRSTEKVIQYAQTDAGRVNCLASDRVQGINLDRAALFAPADTTASTGSTPAVPAN